MIQDQSKTAIEADGPPPVVGLCARRIVLAMAILAACLPAKAARAAMVLVSSGGSTTYSTRIVNIEVAGGQVSPGGPTYSGEGALMSIPGIFSPGQWSPGEGNLTQTRTFDSMSSTMSFTADPSRIGSPEAPFGAGSTSLTAFASGTIAAGATSRSGLNWSSTFVSTPEGALPGQASVSVTTATATFRNNSTTAVSGRVGASLSLQGVLDSTATASFVAASLTTSITTVINGVTTNHAVNTIYFGYGFNTAQGKIVFAPPAIDGTLYNNGVLSLYDYKYTGIARLGSVSFGLNDSYTVTSTLTMIADPASMRMGSVTDPDVISLLPDFGTYVATPLDLGVDSPAITPSAVPEPGTLAAAILGLAGAAIAARRSRWRA